MCAIAGILAFGERHVAPAILQRMNDTLAHRGPDGEAFVFGAGEWGRLHYRFVRRAGEHPLSVDAPIRIGLGHRRLAILDLSDRGLQPMEAGDGRAWLVFNGEIYNHRELRGELASRGHGFTTRTDTEVLLHAYLEWGEGCLAHLEGMFAFAVWDVPAGRLFCARDRLGIKPFYYATPPGYFVFASEIKALMAFPGCTPAADDEAVVGFLVHANCDYGARTVFREVQALPAGHALRVDAATGRLAAHRYWRPEVHATDGLGNEEYVDRIRRSLYAAIRKHLVSDVRAGSCLSGGLDSSAVVGMIGKVRRDEPGAGAATGERLLTFTSCYDDRAFDEREYALDVARSVDAAPNLVFPSANDFWTDFPRMAWHQDMPFGALSYYAQWRVMRAAREAGVTVLLDGQGGDEVFGGYAKFRYAYLASLLRSGRFKTMLAELAGTVRQGDRYVLDIRNGYRYLPASWRRALRVDAVLERVLIPDWHEAAGDDSTPAGRWWRNARAAGLPSASSVMQRIQIDDLVVDTLPQLLRMEDRSSMAFSLEARVPLLDHNVVQSGLDLPDHLKVNAGWSKFALREAMAGVIPDSVRLRTTKLGFAAPDRPWLSHDLRDRVLELLAGDLRCRRYVDVARLRRWYSSPGARSANTEAYLGFFRILSLEMWMRAFGVS